MKTNFAEKPENIKFENKKTDELHCSLVDDHSYIDKMVSAHSSSSEELEHHHNQGNVKTIYNNTCFNKDNAKNNVTNTEILITNNGTNKKKSIFKKSVNVEAGDKSRKVTFKTSLDDSQIKELRKQSDEKKFQTNPFVFESKPLVPNEESHGKSTQMKESKEVYEKRKTYVLESIISSNMEENLQSFDKKKRKLHPYPVRSLDVLRVPINKIFADNCTDTSNIIYYVNILFSQKTIT